MAAITQRDEFGRIPSKWSIEKSLQEAKKYKFLKDFRNESPSAYSYLVRHKSTHLIEIAPTKRHRLPMWEIFCALKKSVSISDFEERFPKECTAFYKRKKFIDKSAYSHFPESKTAKKWTKEKIIEEAKKYEYRSVFCKNSSGAYSAAINLGVLKEVCAHMNSRQSDFNVVYVWTAKKEIGMRLVKIGITSKRLGITRINFVEQKSGFCAQEIIMSDSNDAKKIEVNLKKIGLKADIGEFSGSTEFFWVNSDQYSQIVKEIKNGAKI